MDNVIGGGLSGMLLTLTGIEPMEDVTSFLITAAKMCCVIIKVNEMFIY